MIHFCCSYQATFNGTDGPLRGSMPYVTHELELEPFEHIVKVTGELFDDAGGWGGTPCQITFHTTHGRTVGPIGTNRGHPLVAEGYPLLAISGEHRPAGLPGLMHLSFHFRYC